MVYSMTGYGKSIEKGQLHKITTEIRTVNHRFLDVKLHLPHSLLQIEDKIKQVIQSFFTRGRVDVYVRIESENSSPYDIQVDWPLLDQYVEQIDKIKNRYTIKEDLSIEFLKTLPDVFLIEQREQLLKEIKDMLFKSVEQACADVKVTRLREGSNLKRDMLKRMQTLNNMVLSLEDSQPIIVKNYSDRIKERVLGHIEDTIIADQARLYQEIALLAEKGDIAEEITRLKSHITYSLELFNENEPIGRKLDYIIQEILRELNTIGSKAIEEKTSHLIVEAKSELEKVREQVQNIE